MTTVVAVHGVTKRFGGVAAVRDVDVTISQGERRAVLGPNGAGKTTLFNLISGIDSPTAGRVELFGRDVTHLDVRHRARMGLSRTFQTSRLLGGLSVADNLYLAALGTAGGHFRLLRTRRDQQAKEQAARAADSAGLAGRQSDQAASLSHGEQRQLEIGLAIAARPRLLLLDEPAAGLSRSERQQLTNLLLSLARDVTLVLIEHDMDVALTVADRVTMMHEGALITEGTPEEIRADQRVHDLYLDAAMAEPVLRAREVNAYYGSAHVLHDLSFAVTEQTTAIIGRNGMGKTTLCKAIMGIQPPRARGSIRFAGTELLGRAPYEVCRAGIAYVPQGRHVFPSLTTDEHLKLVGKSLARRGAWTVDAVYDLYPQLAGRRKLSGALLSGGEQQMLAIARALLTNPRLIVMDEPSEGLAPAAVDSLVDTCRDLIAEGVGLLIVEQNFAVATALARRLLVMVGGEIALDTDAATLTEDGEAQRRYLGVEPVSQGTASSES